MYERFKHSGLVLEIEKETHLIRNVEFTFVTKLAQQYLEQLVVGANFYTDLELLITRIQEHFSRTFAAIDYRRIKKRSSTIR